MNSDTAMPITPSILTSYKCSTMEAASTAEVVITSLRLSAAVASRAFEFILLPIFRLNSIINSFTNMEAHSTHTAVSENSIGSGLINFCTELLPSSRPMKSIITATVRPAMYSIRAWP